MTALPECGSFAKVDPTHVAAVGPAAAILFARISWRAQATGEWRATKRELIAETGLSAEMIRTATKVLRDRQWVQTRRTSADDATLIWSAIHAGQAENVESTPPLVDSPPPPGESTPTPPGESTLSSLETVEDSLLVVVPEPQVAAEKPKRALRTKGKKTAYPSDFAPKQTHWDLATSLDVDLSIEGPKFADYHVSKGSTFIDWDAALRNWIRNAHGFAKDRANVHPLRASDKPRTYLRADQIAEPPPGLTDAEYFAWEREQRQNRTAQ